MMLKSHNFYAESCALGKLMYTPRVSERKEASESALRIKKKKKKNQVNKLPTAGGEAKFTFTFGCLPGKHTQKDSGYVCSTTEFIDSPSSYFGRRCLGYNDTTSLT